MISDMGLGVGRGKMARGRPLESTNIDWEEGVEEVVLIERDF